MEFKKLFKSLSKLEIVLLIIFIIYVVLPIETPKNIVDYVESPLGMLIIFITSIYLFFHANSIIAIIYILVAYELLRRSSQEKGKVVLKEYKPRISPKLNSVNAPNPNPIPTKKSVSFNSTPKIENIENIENMENLEPVSLTDDKMNISNIMYDNTGGDNGGLEIEMVKQMMPLQNILDNNIKYNKSDFKPVLDPVNGGSLF